MNVEVTELRVIPLTGKNGDSKFAIIDIEDYEKVSKFRWHWNGRYPQRSYNSKGKITHEKLHKFLITDIEPGKVVDHINGDTLDNRRVNLRVCTQTENTYNRKVTKNSSKYKGVCFSKFNKKWACYITVNKKRINLGYHTSEYEAAKTYDYYAVKIFKDFAKLNFKDEEICRYYVPNLPTGIYFIGRYNSYGGKFKHLKKSYYSGQGKDLKSVIDSYNAKLLEILGDESAQKIIKYREEDYLLYD